MGGKSNKKVDAYQSISFSLSLPRFLFLLCVPISSSSKSYKGWSRRRRAMMLFRKETRLGATGVLVFVVSFFFSFLFYYFFLSIPILFYFLPLFLSLFGAQFRCLNIYIPKHRFFSKMWREIK